MIFKGSVSVLGKEKEVSEARDGRRRGKRRVET
jgi:hypothetical protein